MNKKKLANNFSKEKLWLAKKIKDSAIHPDTGEKIPMPFRMAGFVPFGSPIAVGLMIPNPTNLTLTFWQILNQSHNAMINYFNRNATKQVSLRPLMESYLGAVGSAVGIAVGLSVLIKRAQRLPPATRFFIQKFVPFPAVSAAGVCNVVLMRRTELSTGIDVKDAQGNVIGTSKLAAKKALYETALTRAFLPAPVLVFTPLLMTLIERTSFLNKFPKLRLPIQTVITTLLFGLALPIAISLFPQTGSITADTLEPEISKSGHTILYYNKGL